MCFALLAIQQHPQYSFILAANRDEFFKRPATALGVWPDQPSIVGGMDQSSQGSWLALNQTSLKFALVTNVRQGIPQIGTRSRGLVVSEFVASPQPALSDLKQLAETQNQYAGFNLLAGYLPNEIYYLSNRYSSHWQALNQGYYGLSNASLNTPWPKVQRGLVEFEYLVNNSQNQDQVGLVNKLFELLADRTVAKPEQLPDTGIGLEKELWLSPIFIAPGFMDYGTRCSTIILMNKNKQVFCYERTYYSDNRSSDAEYFFEAS